MLKNAENAGGMAKKWSQNESEVELKTDRLGGYLGSERIGTGYLGQIEGLFWL